MQTVDKFGEITTAGFLVEKKESVVDSVLRT